MVETREDAPNPPAPEPSGPGPSAPHDAWHTLDPAEVARRLRTDPERGLEPGEAARRLERHGENRLAARAQRGAWRILGEQLRGTLIHLLLVAALASAWLGEWRDAAAILAIVVLNTVLGFVQDYRAERAMAALSRMAEPRARVRRRGVEATIDARELVPGDVVLLAAGDRVAADARLVESFDLEVEEAALTGESRPVAKDPAPLADAEVPLGDRVNRVFQGTLVTRGRAHAMVVATGMTTELGKIAGLLQGVERQPTPLQRRLSRLGRDLSVAAVVLVAIVVAAGVAAGADLRTMFMVGLALAVAAVPEGLPAVATLALAIGARRMLERHALIRKLPAVETLGSVTVICTDKTGTLTRNRMRVVAIEPADASFDPERDSLDDRPALAWLLATGALCNDAPSPQAETEGDETEGDPTEVALVAAALEHGLDRARLSTLLPRVAEVPFDAERRRMSTVHALPVDRSSLPAPLRRLEPAADAPGSGGALVLAKGAAESVLAVATRVWRNDGLAALDETRRRDVLAAEAALADQGMRVLALAYRGLERDAADVDPRALEAELVFLGLVGLADPLRPGAREAVESCRRAGIRPVMITGDHPRTAIAIARQAGIAREGRTVEGRRLARLAPAALAEEIESIEVFARVSPEDKLRIVEALAQRGEIVAMTGDGVNDAPSLRRADIGVAMGVTGTDVARDAADMVLLDDDFSTIVAAVRQGRRVYDNIRRFLLYTLTSNTGEIVTMVLAPLLGLPLALLPLQILWVNLVTDGLPGLALGVEREESGVMRRPPIAPGARLLDRAALVDILWIGATMAAISLAAAGLLAPASADEARWRTVIFTVLTFSQMGNALASRSFHTGFWRRSLLESPALVGAVSLTFFLQLAVIYVPQLQEIFDTVALSGPELAGATAAGSLLFWAIEGRKAWRSRRAAGAEEFPS